MSVTAVGPALRVNGPLPRAPRFSLLSIPGVRQDQPDGHWMNGLGVWGYPSDVPSLWEPCSTGTYRTKVEGEAPTNVRFDPIVIYEPVTCSAMSVVDWEEFQQRAELVLEATQSFASEQALSQGTALSTNPFFGDANLTVLGGGAVAPDAGIAYLEEAIGGTGRGGMIHVTPAVPGVLGYNVFRHVDPDGNDFSGDEYLVTANGTPVASGGGYIGADPVGQSAATAGQSWAYATGPVEVYISDVQIVGENINDTLDTSNNDVTFRAEKYIVAEWDTALQAGVLIDWTTCCANSTPPIQ